MKPEMHCKISPFGDMWFGGQPQVTSRISQFSSPPTNFIDDQKQNIRSQNIIKDVKLFMLSIFFFFKFGLLGN